MFTTPPDYPVPAIPIDLNVPGIDLKLWMAEDAFALLDHPKYQQQYKELDELIPYWAELWPAARFLSKLCIDRFSTVKKLKVLEIGAGLGAVGMTLSKLGHDVTLTDVAPDAIDILKIHIRENNLTAKTATLDFFADEVLEQAPFDLIVGADILFEKRFCQPVIDTIVRHLAPNGLCLISDPQRKTADPFENLSLPDGFQRQITLHNLNELEAMGLKKMGQQMRLFELAKKA